MDNHLTLDPYIADTEENLWRVIERFSKTGNDLGSFTEFLKTDFAQKVVLLIGWDQISGSLSPFMHTYSSYLNNNPFLYTLFKMTKENRDLGEIFEYIRSEKKILWANITMPYKIEIFNILSDLWLLDESARLVGAVNTIAKKDWEVRWYNTDMYWVLNPVMDALWEKVNSIKKWYVLWAGWAARAAIAALLQLWIHDITIFNRTDQTMINLVNHFNSKEAREVLKNCFSIKMVEYDIQYDEKSHISEYIDEKGILINTLPFWFKSHLAKYPIREDELKKVFDKITLYFDVVYDMNYPGTPMSEYVRVHHPDIMICDWIDMVVEQARKWYEMWSGGDKIDAKNIKHIIRSK